MSAARPTGHHSRRSMCPRAAPSATTPWVTVRAANAGACGSVLIRRQSNPVALPTTTSATSGCPVPTSSSTPTSSGRPPTPSAPTTECRPPMPSEIPRSSMREDRRAQRPSRCGRGLPRGAQRSCPSTDVSGRRRLARRTFARDCGTRAGRRRRGPDVAGLVGQATSTASPRWRSCVARRSPASTPRDDTSIQVAP